MNLLRKKHKTVLRTLLVLYAIVFYCSVSNANPLNSAIGDSLSPENPKPVFDLQINSIQTMNKAQLTLLVDYLFEMDTIPFDLVNNINAAISNLVCVDIKKEVSGFSDIISFPSADFYTGWEINNLFPEKDMLKLKGDTSVTLNLQAFGHNNYINPFNGAITSNFGWRDSVQHKGIDFDLNKGDKVVSAFDGMVRIAKCCGGFGNVVIIRHYNGLETVYAHLSKLKVKPGQLISAGELIGLGGSTGHSTGSHLHFEVRFKGVPVNPKYLISFADGKLLCEELVIKKTKWGLAAFPKDEKQYTIEKGDTIFEIAKRFGTTTASIKQMNGLNGRIRLIAGQTINVAQ